MNELILYIVKSKFESNYVIIIIYYIILTLHIYIYIMSILVPIKH